MSIISDAHEVLTDGRQEVAEANLAKKALLGFNLASLAFEWGTGNEALIGMIGGTVMRHTNDILITAAATGATSFIEQSAFGLTTALSMHAFPRTMDGIRSKIVDKRRNTHEAADETPSESQTSHSSGSERFLAAFALGTSVKAMSDNAVEHHTLRDNTKNVLKDAGLIGGGVTGIAALAAGATNLGRSTGLQSEANIFVDVITSPFTYAGLFGLKVLNDFKNRFNKGRHIMPEDGGVTNFGDGYRVELQYNPSHEDQEKLWTIVQSGFATLNSQSYEKQDMTKEEFLADMASPHVVKLIAYDASGNPTGYVNAHLGTKEAIWANQDILQQEQSKFDSAIIPYYVGTVVVSPDLRGTGAAIRLLQALLTQFQQNGEVNGRQSLAFFDCADANHPSLAKFIEKCAEPAPQVNFAGVEIDIDEIGREHWIKSRASGEVEKTEQLPEDANSFELLDTQHYYRIATS